MLERVCRTISRQGQLLEFGLEECWKSYKYWALQSGKAINQVNPDRVKPKFKFAKISEENSWKVDFAKELDNLKQNVLQLDPDLNILSQEELQDILDYICTS